MKKRVVFLKQFEINDWVQYFSFLKFAPTPLRKKIVSYMPCLTIAEIELKTADNLVEGYILAYPTQRIPYNLDKRIKMINPDVIITGTEASPALAEKLEPGKLLNGFSGQQLKILLLNKAFKELIQVAWKEADHPKIMIWGADKETGARLARILAAEWKKIIIAGEDWGNLNHLAHSILYETGTAVKIMQKPYINWRLADVVISMDIGIDELNGCIPIRIDASLLEGPKIKINTARKNFRFVWDFYLAEGILHALADIRGQDIWHDYKVMVKEIGKIGFNMGLTELFENALGPSLTKSSNIFIIVA